MVMFTKTIFLCALLLASTACNGNPLWTPIYSSSIDPIFDTIRADDPSAFVCIEYSGRESRQIWDKRVDGEPYVEAFLFNAKYSDGHTIEIAINPEFEDSEQALTEAKFYTTALGQIPSSLRSGIKTFSVHKGNEGFHAGAGGIVFYSNTARLRLQQKHLEESIFHESVHASWDSRHATSEPWINAQTSDNGFVTAYGAKFPTREDLAESALLAFAVIHHPGRIPPADTDDIFKIAPSRVKFIKNLLPTNEPLIDISPKNIDCRP